MGNKTKGSNIERELIQMLWESGWAPVRVAGSGSAQIPSADIIAGKNGRVIIIECKSSISDKIYIEKQRIDEFNEFQSRFGAEAWIGARFSRKKWRFLKISQLRDSGKNVVIDSQICDREGMLFNELIKDNLI